MAIFGLGKSKAGKTKRVVTNPANKPKPKPGPVAPLNPQGIPVTLARPGPAVPPPTFEVNPESLLGGPTAGEAGRLDQIDAAANARQLGKFGTDETRLREDLASQLSAFGLKQKRAEDDVNAAISKAKSELPARQQKINSAMAARGAAYSSANEGAQTQAATDVDDYEKKQQAELGQLRDDIATQMSQTNQSADRALADIKEAKEAEKQQQEAQGIKGKISARKSAASAVTDQNKEASSWIPDRVNELMRSGMEESAAQSMAIVDARNRWPGATATAVEGRLKPAASKPYSMEKYGVDISVARGQKMNPKNTAANKKAPYYKPFTQAYGDYIKSAGGDASMQGYLNFIAKAVQSGDFLSEADQAAGKKDNVQSFMRRWPHLISQVAYENGLR